MLSIVAKLHKLRVGDQVRIRSCNQKVITCERIVETDDGITLDAIHISVDNVLAIKVGLTKFYPITPFKVSHMSDAVLIDEIDADLKRSHKFWNILRCFDQEFIWTAYNKMKYEKLQGIYRISRS